MASSLRSDARLMPKDLGTNSGNWERWLIVIVNDLNVVVVLKKYLYSDFVCFRKQGKC